MDGFKMMTLAFAVFFASTLQGLTGFGSAILSMAILSFFFPISFVTPYVCLMGTTVCVILLIRSWKGFNLRLIAPLLLGAIVGIPVGVFGFVHVGEYVVKKILAALIFAYALYMIIGHVPRFKVSKNFGYLFGFLSGCFGGAFNITGPPVIIYATLTDWSKDEIVATLQSYFLICSVIILAAQSLNGAVTYQSLHHWLLSIPLIVLGIYVGFYYHKKIDSQRFRKYICFALLALSVCMAAS